VIPGKCAGKGQKCVISCIRAINGKKMRGSREWAMSEILLKIQGMGQVNGQNIA